jgi:hypothetical protein
MAEWAAAAEVEGLFPGRADSPAGRPSQDVLREPSKPVFKEDLKSKWLAATPTFARAAAAVRTNLERFRKFVQRQHLGTRLRLLIAATARGAVRCYNAARPHVIRAWQKRPSKQEVKEWSTAKAQQASEAWSRTTPWRSRLGRQTAVGLGKTREGLPCLHVVDGYVRQTSKAERLI